jgi:YegS/Rv2252/BmrU family lipid kinase
MPLKRITIIANPRAGQKRQADLTAALELLNRHIPTELVITNHSGHATELARIHGEDPDTLVTTCGGDGTIFEALNGLPRQGVLGILPGGTANVVARELGIPLFFRDAVKTLLSGAVQTLDVGVFDDRKYLMVAGVGYDAHAAWAVPSWRKRMLGKYAYHLEAFLQFPGYQPPCVTVTVDGRETYEGQFAMIANMRRYGGDFFFAQDARYDDGLLDLVLIREVRFWNLVKAAWKAKKREGVPESLAYRLRGREFLVKCRPAIPFQLDGEVFSPITQAVVRVSPRAVRVVMP